MHRITQEIPKRAWVFGYGSFTLYGAAFQKLHLTFALPRRAPTTPDSFLRSVLSSLDCHSFWCGRSSSHSCVKERFAAPLARLIEPQVSKHTNESGLACSAFARHYLRNRIRFLFLRLLRCFTSPGVAMFLLWIHRNSSKYYPAQVTPFGNLRVKACLPLTVAYRSLPRPSSPIGTKASMMRSL